MLTTNIGEWTPIGMAVESILGGFERGWLFSGMGYGQEGVPWF
jgi:hypothetical protein